MDAVALLQRLHQHRAWVNERLLTAAAALSGEQLRRPCSIGQGSVWQSLLHLYAAEYVWLAALEGNDDPTLPGDLPGRLPGNQLAGGGVIGLDDLQRRWTAQEQRWRDQLTTLTVHALDDLVYKRSTSSGAGQRLGVRRADVLLHVCTHAQYTTAQLVNMLRQVGAEKLPDVMLITLARQERGKVS